MRQRPCWFNYGSEGVYENRDLLCEKLDVSPHVRDEFDFGQNPNPNPKILDYRWAFPTKPRPFRLPFWALPIFNPNYPGLFLDYCAQLSKIEIDFHPENIINLPQQLNPPLNNQRFAFHLTVCAGIACPTAEEQDALMKQLEQLQQELNKIHSFVPLVPEILVPIKNLNCFCINAYLTGGCSIFPDPQDINLPYKFRAVLDAISFPEINPIGMDKAIECYAKLVIDLFLVPQLNESLNKIMQPIELGKDEAGESYGLIRLSLPSLPSNPSIEDDKLKAFINLDEISLNVKFPPKQSDINPKSSPPPGQGPPPPLPDRIQKQRIRTGNFDLTSAISSSAINKIFQAFIKGFRFGWNDEGSWTYYFKYKYLIETHLEGGQITLQDNGSVKVTNIIVKFDKLEFEAGIDLPRVCVTPPPPYVGPDLCFFGDNPDLKIRINLAKYFSIKIEDFTARFEVFYRDGTQSGVQSKWELYLHPVEVDVGIEQINKEELKNDVEKLITDTITEILPGKPLTGLVLNTLKALLGGFDSLADLVLNKLVHLGIFPDWFVHLLKTKNFLEYWEEELASNFFKKQPVFERDDPIRIMESIDILYLGKHNRVGPDNVNDVKFTSKLIPVMLPVEYINVEINSNELILEADIADNY